MMSRRSYITLPTTSVLPQILELETDAGVSGFLYLHHTHLGDDPGVAVSCRVDDVTRQSPWSSSPNPA